MTPRNFALHLAHRPEHEWRHDEFKDARPWWWFWLSILAFTIAVQVMT